MTPELITIIGLVIIIAAFIYYLRQASKLYFCRRNIVKATKSDDVIKALQKSKLSQLTAQYEQTITVSIKNEKKTNIPASAYFSELCVFKQIQLNPQMLDVASSTLVGLGLLGTFAGLTAGIKDFDSSTTDNIQRSIQVLLGGMGTAFVTSLVGMLASIIYSAFEKPWKNKLTRALYEMTENLDAKYYIDDLALMQLNQSILFNEIQMRQEKKLTELTQDIVGSIVAHLTYTNENGQQVLMANSIREMLKENIEQTKALKSFSTDLAMQLNDGFDQVLSNQMQQKIVPLMENVDTTTKAIVEHIDQMAAQVSTPATDMIQIIVNELKQSMTSMVSEFKNNLSAGANTQIETLANILGTASKSMTEFPRNMETISATLQMTIDEVKNAIAEISSTSASSNTKAMQQMQEQITFATTSISNAIVEVKDVMTSLTHSSEQSSNDMIARLSAASEQMAVFMNDSMNQMSASMQESIKEVLSGVCASLSDVTTTVNSIMKTSEESSQGVASRLTSVSEQMGALLQSTMQNVTSSVQSSMQSITDDVVSKQADLLALQESTMEETRKLLVMFNNGLSRLEQVNTAIGGTMDTFQAAQGEISGTTSNLHIITSDMKTATEVFQKSQSDYAGSMEALQQMSQRNLDTVVSLLKDSGEMSQEYVEKFEAIRIALSEIFAQLQTGLNQYSLTVRTSLEDYLNKYSANLTKATEALSSAIGQQSEVVEMLSESISKHK